MENSVMKTEKREQMETKKKLTEILSNIPAPNGGFYDLSYFTDYLIDHGVTCRPAVPGPVADNPNIMELCFRNGEANMKEKVISLLMDHKTQCRGACHAHVVEIIRMVEAL